MEERRESPLQLWAMAHQPDEEMRWKDAFWEQIMFVRDQIASLLSRSYEEFGHTLPDVAGEHTSKSIKCPVYYLDLKRDGVKVWMRYNFYDWNISIQSEQPITCDFLGVFDDDPEVDYRFCQGMEDKKFGYYRENNKQFTVYIASDYDVYTFFRVLRKFLGIKKED
jgi:hypothetical protein